MSHQQTSIQRWTLSLCPVLLAVASAYVWFYRSRICKKPRFVSVPPFRVFLERHCPVVREKFSPTIWCFGGRIQTILRVVLLPKPPVPYRNEILKTADGGQISLDWVDNNESSRFPDAASRPTVIFLPGLTGNSRQSYILHLVRQASRDGYRSVVFNNRGFGGEELLTPRTFCAANTDDLSVVVSHVHKQFPDAPVVAVGVSLGGMMLLNYLAAQGPSARLWAALCFSTPWNVFESTRSLEEPLNYFLFNYSLNKSLRSATEQHRRVIGRAVDVDYVLQSRSIREFDERYTSVVWGFPSCDEYYTQASPDSKLGHIRTPVLCLNAADDPLSPGTAIPVAEASTNPHVALLIPAHGGHIGFLEGLIPNHQQYMDRVFQQFVGAILEHREELNLGQRP